MYESDVKNIESGEKIYVRKKVITPEIQDSRAKDIEQVLDSYRENLKNHGVNDSIAIEKFADRERDKMVAEYSSLDEGNVSDNIYILPTNWNEISEEMKHNYINTKHQDFVVGEKENLMGGKNNNAFREATDHKVLTEYETNISRSENAFQKATSSELKRGQLATGNTLDHVNEKGLSE